MAVPTAADLAAFLGQDPDDTTFGALAGQAIATVTAIVRTYTRGKGFVDGDPGDDLSAVILTASARLAINPQQTQHEELADFKITPAVFHGFTLAETMVLNAHRKRSQL